MGSVISSETKITQHANCQRLLKYIWQLHTTIDKISNRMDYGILPLVYMCSTKKCVHYRCNRCQYILQNNYYIVVYTLDHLQLPFEPRFLLVLHFNMLFGTFLLVTIRRGLVCHVPELSHDFARQFSSKELTMWFPYLTCFFLLGLWTQ